jgi:hypothetical protein
VLAAGAEGSPPAGCNPAAGERLSRCCDAIVRHYAPRRSAVDSLPPEHVLLLLPRLVVLGQVEAAGNACCSHAHV